MIDLSPYIDFNYNFGPTITFWKDFPTEYSFPDGTLNIVLKDKNLVFDQYYLQPGFWFRNFCQYYIPLDIEIYGVKNKQIVKVFEHKFDLTNKDVLFDLHPKSEIESKIWLDYLTIFQSKTQCNISIQNILNTPHNFLKHDSDIEYYASYKISWEENIYHNPYGIDVNSFDLINNKLLRV